MPEDGHVANALERIARVLERAVPSAAETEEFEAGGAYLWRTGPDRFERVASVSRVPLELLRGIDSMRDDFLENLRRFSRGHASNNVLLWGARGMGKSSLVKAAHAAVCAEEGGAPALIEVDRSEIDSLHRLLGALAEAPSLRFVLFCDDLSFEEPDSAYKTLKAVLEGGIAGRPDNVLFCATSNRRHLMPREMIENERRSAISPGEATDEKVSLSDRFGLWLGFHPCTQEQYLEMARGYCDAWGIDIGDAEFRARAVAWRQARGAVSGRVAWQFACDLAGDRGLPAGG